MECKNCGKETNKISVVTRSFIYLNERKRQRVDEKYYCPNCTKEINQNVVGQAVIETFLEK